MSNQPLLFNYEENHFLIETNFTHNLVTSQLLAEY